MFLEIYIEDDVLGNRKFKVILRVFQIEIQSSTDFLM